jgi:hypothetical protein
MPTFSTLPPSPPPILPGTYIAKVISASERVSEAGNDMIVMRLLLPDGRALPCCLTFVPQARPVLNAFCDSAGLTKPSDPDVEVQLTAEICKGRYLYITVSTEVESSGDPTPRIVRFLTRDQALILNPALAKTVLQPQEPIQLPVVSHTPNLFK